jgi:hypothetical protein
MAHSYTPGLKVLNSSNIEKIRRLPIRGKVTRSVGDKLKPDDIVATTDLPGNVQIIKIASRLNIGPADIYDALKVSEGQKNYQGRPFSSNSRVVWFIQIRGVFTNRWFY